MTYQLEDEPKKCPTCECYDCVPEECTCDCHPVKKDENNLTLKL